MRTTVVVPLALYVVMIASSAFANTITATDNNKITALQDRAFAVLSDLDNAEKPISQALEHKLSVAKAHNDIQVFICFENLAQDTSMLSAYINQIKDLSLVESMMTDKLDDTWTKGVLEIEMERLKGMLAMRSTAYEMGATCATNAAVQRGVGQFLKLIDATDDTLTPIAKRMGVH